MPHWYWDKKELRSTPSQIQSNLDFDTEMRYRREGVRFILELGKSLNLFHTTMASAAVYFHRFYMFHSFNDFPKYVVATCCLFLAGKAEETPKKCRDIINTVRRLTNDKQFSTFGVDPREEVMVLERVLLQTIKFDLDVDHPYSSLIKYAKCLKGDKAKLQKMVQMSWTFVNDSLCTTLCLQWEPEIVAIALMYLAAKLSKFEVKDWNDRSDWHKHWWDLYVEHLDVEVLEDICHQVLDLYAQPHTPAKEQAGSPPPGARPSSSTISSNSATAGTSKSSKSSNSSTPNQPQKTTPPPPRDTAQPPPPPAKSRPHTPPQPPMPHPSAAAIGAPAVNASFQQTTATPILPQTYASVTATSVAPRPPLPSVSAVAPPPVVPYPPPQVYYPPVTAGPPLPPPQVVGAMPPQHYAGPPPPPGPGFPPYTTGGVVPPPPTGAAPPPSYYNQPPPPHLPPTGGPPGYHRPPKHPRY